MRQPINNPSRVPAYLRGRKSSVSAIFCVEPLPMIGEGLGVVRSLSGQEGWLVGKKLMKKGFLLPQGRKKVRDIGSRWRFSGLVLNKEE